MPPSSTIRSLLVYEEVEEEDQQLEMMHPSNKNSLIPQMNKKATTTNNKQQKKETINGKLTDIDELGHGNNKQHQRGHLFLKGRQPRLLLLLLLVNLYPLIINFLLLWLLWGMLVDGISFYFHAEGESWGLGFYV